MLPAPRETTSHLKAVGATVLLCSIGAEKRPGAGEIDGLALTEELLDATGAVLTDPEGNEACIDWAGRGRYA